ncbi:MAG: glycosyltransferase family 2 protein [Croceivirga sp.]
MRLSIIIPLYNKKQYLGRCLDSVLTQDLTKAEYEVIIVDDGSTDNGISVVKDYMTKNTNIRCYSQKNSGPSAARNKGLNSANGDYIYFLDADDYLTSNVLGSLVDSCEQHHLEILEFNTKEIEEDSLNYLHNEGGVFSTKLGSQVMDGISYVSTFDLRNEIWHYFINRKFLINSGIRFFENMYAFEDLIFTTRIFLLSKKTAKSNIVGHRYVKAANSIVRSKDTKTNRKFIDGMMKAVEHLHHLIDKIDSSHKNHTAISRIKGKQQAIVFAFLIKVFKYRLLNKKDLKSMLDQMRVFGAYPVQIKLDTGWNRYRYVKEKIIIPIFNNEKLLIFCTQLIRLCPRN